MDSLSKVISNHEEFLSETPDGKYSELDNGQSPEILFITCSDSRVCPSIYTKTEPGDLFVIRNAGNIVPSKDAEAKADLGTIQFAVDVLGVKDIVVCGHTDCGAVKGLLAPDSVESLQQLKEWLCACPSTEGLNSEKSLLENVQTHALNQLESLKTLEFVQEKLAAGQLRLHAWVLDLGKQRLSTCDLETGEWQSLVPGDGTPTRGGEASA